MASQIQLTNTFNEFRQAYNNAAEEINTLDAANTALNDGSATPNVSTIDVVGSATVGDNFSVGQTKFTVDTTSGDVDVEQNFSVGGDAAVTGNVEITGTLDVEESFTVGTDKFTVDAETGDIVATGNLELTFEESRIDAYHIHAEWHIAAGGDVEEWAAGKGTDVDQHKVFGIGDSNGPVDMAIVNEADGADAYAEFIAINDTGDIDNGWCSFGINSSNYAEAEYGVTKADDGYLLFQAPAGTEESGDLVIGTGGNGTGNKILFSANGFDDPANNTQMIIHPGEKVEISIDTESSNTGSGALVVRGGIGLEGNLNVGGDVNIIGNITLGGSGNTVSLDSLQVEGPIVFVANNNPADTFDIGIVGQYVDGGSITRYTGAVRDASDGGRYKIFANANAEFQTDIANTVNFSDPDLTFSSVQVGSVFVSDTTASTSTTTGAITTSGGVGVAGAAYVGGIVRATNTTASTSTATGAVVVTGGVGIAGDTFAGGLVRATNSTASTSTATGAVVVTGGVGVGGNSYIGGLVRATNTTASTSDTTGALTVSGGVGIGGAANIGGALGVTGATTLSGGAILAAGTTTVAPLRFTTGTNLTTQTAGAVEYSGSVLSITNNTSVGRVPVAGEIVSIGAGTGGNAVITGSVNYALFPAATDTITLPVGTYAYEIDFRMLLATSTVSAFLRWHPRGGGTAVGTFSFFGFGSITSPVAGAAPLIFSTPTALPALTGGVQVTAASAVAGRDHTVTGRGIIRVTTAGTIIPAWQWSATVTSGVVTLNNANMMKITQLSSSGTTAATGAWS